MFETTSYLGDSAYAAGGEPLWYQLGFASKEAWKHATGQDGGGIPITGAGSGSSATGAGGTPTTGAAPGASAGGGFSLSSIPSTYLLIGGAVLLLMMFKK